MKLYIPTLGTRLQLTTNWKFRLYSEDRNRSLWKFFDFPEEEYDCWHLKVRDAILPKGTILVVDRIYIRATHNMKYLNRSSHEFDSITFKAQFNDGTKSIMSKSYKWSEKESKRQIRFWAKLSDVNTINCKILLEGEKVNGEKEDRRGKQIASSLQD